MILFCQLFIVPSIKLLIILLFQLKYWKEKGREEDAVYYLSRTTRPWSLIVGLQPNTYYFVKVMAYNAAGEGPESERFLGKYIYVVIIIQISSYIFITLSLNWCYTPRGSTAFKINTTVHLKMQAKNWKKCRFLTVFSRWRTKQGGEDDGNLD